MSDGAELLLVPKKVCTPAKLTDPLLGVLAVPALKLSLTSTLPVVIVLKLSVLLAVPPPTKVSTAPAAALNVVPEQSEGDVQPVNSLMALKLATVAPPKVASSFTASIVSAVPEASRASKVSIVLDALAP